VIRKVPKATLIPKGPKMAGAKRRDRPTGGSGEPKGRPPKKSDGKAAVEAGAKGKAMDLDALKAADPTFYKYLEKHDADLLQFDLSDDSGADESDDDLDEDLGEDGEGDEGDSRSKSLSVINQSVLASLTNAAFSKKTFKGVVSLLAAFRSACHAHEVPDEEAKAARHGAGGRKFVIHSSSLFAQLMSECLSHFHDAFWHLIEPGKVTDAHARVRGLQTFKGFGKMEPVLKSFLTNLICE
jgi:nucleolar complex protein 2